jgi:hypothetical protein
MRDLEYLERIVDEKVDFEMIRKLKIGEYVMFGEKNFEKFL